MKIRTSMNGMDTIVNDVVVGHLDKEGWWPSVFVKDTAFKFTPENLRSIASNIEGWRALSKTWPAGELAVCSLYGHTPPVNGLCTRCGCLLP